MKKLLIPILACLLLAGCKTPYKIYGSSGLVDYAKDALPNIADCWRANGIPICDKDQYMPEGKFLKLNTELATRVIKGMPEPMNFDDLRGDYNEGYNRDRAADTAITEG